MNPIPALLMVVTFAFAGCVSTQTQQVESNAAPNVVSPLEVGLAALPGPQDPGTANPLQTYKASWSASIRGPQCYVGIVNVCCNGELREFFETVGDGVIFDRFAIDEATWGLPARATFWAAVPTTEGVGFWFINHRGTILGAGHTWMDGPLSHNGIAYALVPPGTTEAVFWSCVTGPMSAWYEAGPSYEMDWFKLQSNAGAGLNVPCPPDVGVGTPIGGASFASKTKWPIRDQMTDGQAARVTNVHIRFISLTMLDAVITIFDANGNEIASGTTPFATKRITKPGEYTVRVEPCGATAGSYTVIGVADLVPAAPIKAGASSLPSASRTTQAYEATWKVGLGPQCYSSLPDPCCSGEVAEILEPYGDGIAFDRFPIDPGTVGTRFTMKGELAVEGFMLNFLDHQGSILSHSWAKNGATDSEAKGTVPEGAVEAVAWSCVSGPMSASDRAGLVEAPAP